ARGDGHACRQSHAGDGDLGIDIGDGGRGCGPILRDAIEISIHVLPRDVRAVLAITEGDELAAKGGYALAVNSRRNLPNLRAHSGRAGDIFFPENAGGIEIEVERLLIGLHKGLGVDLALSSSDWKNPAHA